LSFNTPPPKCICPSAVLFLYNYEDVGTYESNGGGIVSLRAGKNWFVGQDKILLGVELAAGYMDVDDSKQLESFIGVRTLMIV
jgi:hypothetical protein